MEVKSGYKQTDAGLIPKDWDALQLGDGIALLSGHHVLAQHCNTRGEGIPYLTGPADFPNGTIAHTKFTEKQTTLCKPDDILVTVKGSGSGTLVVANGVYCISRQLMAIRVRDWEKRFVYYSLLQNASQIKAASTGLIPGLSRSDILEQVLPFPQAAEQRAIVGALGNADALLATLEKLIAKKRDLKQAAMQQLPTGQTRLPGFTGEWEVKRLGQLFDITSSKRVFQSEWKTEGIPFYRARELAVLGERGCVDNELFISKALYDTYRKAHGVPQVGDMLVTGVGTLGKVYVVTDDREFYFKDGNIIWFKIGGKVSPEFLKQLYLTQSITKQITDASAGTTVGTYTISGAKRTLIPLPPLPEQTAIAEMLSDIDAEIAALEQRLAKTRALKQGMMQELLTGKTRLI